MKIQRSKSLRSGLRAEWILIFLVLVLMVAPSSAAGTQNRAGSVQIFAGQYSGTGTAGQSGAVNQNFSSFDFKLAESGITIRNAFIILEAQLGGLADDGNTVGHKIAFDACVSPCTTDAWAGAGRVEQNQSTTVLQYADVDGGHYVRLLADVTSEAQLAAYTGGGATLSSQVGYWFDAATTDANHINSAKAKLVITYAYDAASSSSTRTVVYPLESTASGDSGSRRASQASACTKNSNCPLFNYSVSVPDFSERISQWFEAGGFNDGNAATDVVRNINIQGTDVDSSNFILESAQGSGQGDWSEGWFSGISGFSENTSQQLEHYFTGGTQYLEGGEVFETYIASSSASIKTKTVSFPIGVVSNGSDTVEHSASTTVYFPESGVSIKKAWFRINVAGDDTSAAYNLAAASKVGSNSKSANWVYNFDAPSIVITESFKVIHVISSSDYAELASATATSGKNITIYTTASNANIRGVSAELMVTYNYTDDSNGYLSSLSLYGGQTATPGNDQTETLSTANSVLPEITGTKTLRAAALRASYSMSESTGAMPGAVANVDTNLATSSPVCTNSFNGDSDAADAFFEFLRNVTSAMNTIDNQTYSACYTNDGASDAETGAKMNGILIYTYQWTGQSDLVMTQTNISFSYAASQTETGEVKENVNVTINATVYNNGSAIANIVKVSFYDGSPGSGNNIANTTIASIAAGASQNATVYWNSLAGTHNISVKVDPDNNITESDETNNNASKFINVSAWQKYYGNVSGNLKLKDQPGNSFKNWTWGSLSGNIFITNVTSLNFSKLQALGRNKSGGIAQNNFSRADVLLNLTPGSSNATGFINNNITQLFSTDGTNPRNTTSFTIYGNIINNVAIVNSTNVTNHTSVENATFITGILWDTTKDDGDGEYGDDSEDFVFISNINVGKTGTVPTSHDYDIAIPSNLKGSGMVYFYAELK